MPRKSSREMALPVGLFIILGLITLVGGALWLRHYSAQPAYSFYVAYQDPAPIAEGVAVYYRGVRVGNVTDVSLTDDYRYTLLKVGMIDPNLRVPNNSEIKIQLEGITGQRYLVIDPPENQVYIGYIEPDEVVRGRESLTLERLQEQLARIAENRTLEKILVKAEDTLSKMQLASDEAVAFMHNANTLLARTQVPAQNALNEITLAARDIRGDFGTFSGGAGEAFLSIREVGDRLNLLIGDVGTELRETRLLGNISRAAEEISSGVSGIRTTFEETAGELRGGVAEARSAIRQTTGSIQGGVAEVRGQVSGARPPEITELNRLLTALEQSAGTLEQQVQAARRTTGNGNLQAAYGQLETLARQIQDEVAESQLRFGEGTRPETIREQLAALQLAGDRISTASASLATALDQRLSGRALRPEARASIRELQDTAQTLSFIGESLSDKATATLPQTGAIVTWYSQSAPAASTQRVGLAATIRQIYDTAARFECVASNINDILNERFLGFKLFFGQPGGDVDCIPSGGQRSL